MSEPEPGRHWPPLDPASLAAVRLATAEARDALETSLEGGSRRAATLLRGFQLVLGAVALGALAAGMSVFGVFIVLNLVFHYAPS
ncbi:MAG: hypothetical protein EA355_09555 [Rhodobacteraceae bacterium]|nr:MAG: hypothetical protein EA355_09555 [Paracoccaceae bacterium]